MTGPGQIIVTQMPLDRKKKGKKKCLVLRKKRVMRKINKFAEEV